MGHLNMYMMMIKFTYIAHLSLPSSSSLTVLASLSASSLSFFSSSLECFSSALAPAPILTFPAWGSSAQKPSFRKKSGCRSCRWSPGAVYCAADINCPQQTMSNVWVYFCLRRGFWASLVHLTEESQWRARTERGERCEEKQTYTRLGAI